MSFYEQAIEEALKGNAVLITGAGFSYNAVNIKNKIIGETKNLIESLCQSYGIPFDDKNSLDEISEYILSSNNYDNAVIQNLIRELQNQFQTDVSSVSETHALIAKIPWMRIYTTNYDDVFENAFLKANNKPIHTFNAYDETSIVAKNQSIIHLNGYIRNLTPEKLNNEFKLTTFSYWQSEFKREKMFELFKQDLDNAKAIIYIGTSLKYDFDISTILNVHNHKNKTIFIDRNSNDFNLGDVKKNKLGFQVKVGIDGFAEKVSIIKKSRKLVDEEYSLECFREIKLNKNIYEENNIQYIWDLLIYGKSNELIIQKNLENDEYVVSREELENINLKKYKVINIHSNLGNGKTVGLLKQAYKWSRDNKVFVLERQKKNLTKDLNEISKLKGHKVIIIEDYTFYKEVLKKIGVHLDNSYTIILTSRSFVNDQFKNQIMEYLDVEIEEIRSINLNFLTKKEIYKFSELIKKLNLDKLNQESNSQIKKIIGDNTNISNILLSLLQSKVISGKIDEIFKDFQSNMKAMSILCATMINNFVNLNIGYSDLCSLINVTSNDIENIKNEKIRELINLDDSRFKLQSSVFSKYLVSSQNISENLISVMKNILENSSVLDIKDEKRVNQILISQSNIRIIFSGLEGRTISSEISSNIVRFFDSIVDIKNHKKNIFFWFQYAIACMDIKLYDRSENYLSISYDLCEAKKKNGENFETFQIDTQYARLILEKKIHSDYAKSNYFEIFTDANEKLEKAMKERPTQARLAFKQMVLFNEYLKKYSSHFSKDENELSRKIIRRHLNNHFFTKRHPTFESMDIKESLNEALMTLKFVK